MSKGQRVIARGKGGHKKKGTMSEKKNEKQDRQHKMEVAFTGQIGVAEAQDILCVRKLHGVLILSVGGTPSISGRLTLQRNCRATFAPAS